MKTLLLLPLLCLAAACTTALTQTRTATEWRQVARGDLDAAHALILASHPGAIDEQNPQFRETSENAYQAALQLIAQVDSYDSVISVVNFYTTSYLDGHLFYSDNIRKGHGVASTTRGNSYSLRDGTLWIRAANFQLQPGTPQAADLDKMLDELNNLKGVRRIVFDARGNAGGDSRVGQRIFEAATGGLQADLPDLEKLPQTYAQWRVSPMALANAEGHVSRMSALHGPDSPQVAAARRFRDELTQAREAGLAWLHVAGGPRVTRDDLVRHGGKLGRFSAGVRVALVTDSNCASACLDFADLVRMVPGMKHVGQTTSYDSVYIDVGVQALPSGNTLMVPLKVWRNRLRANNEALVPDTIFELDMSDDQAVYDATLAALVR